MVEESCSSVRQSFEIEAPSAFEIEDPCARWSNAPNQIKRHPSVRFLLLLAAGVVVGTIAICSCLHLKSDVIQTITPLAIDGTIVDNNISYGTLKLSKNGMRILLGEAMRASVASVAFCLGIGYFSEPKELAGAMIVLAQALLRGSTKYPDEGNWTEYFRQAGELSWSTVHPVVEQTQTCFHFAVSTTFLDGALDRLMEALRNPLLQKDVLQEIVKHERGSWRRCKFSQMPTLLPDMNPDHPTHCPFLFVDSLKANDARSEVLSFFKQHFNARDMTLSIIAPVTLEDMAPLVNRFNMLPGTPAGRPMPRGVQYGGRGVPPFLPGHFAGLVYRAIGHSKGELASLPIEEQWAFIKSDSKLVLSWLLSDFQRSRWREKPSFFALKMLNAAGEGSLIKFLGRQGWIPYDGFEAKQTDEGTYTVFDISIRLTTEGLDHKVAVGTAVFEYLKFLRTVPRKTVADWLKREQSLQDLNFKYLNFEYPDGFEYQFTYDGHLALRARALAQGLLSYPEHYVVSAPVRLFKTDAEAQIKLLSELTVESVRVMVTAHKYDYKCAQAPKDKLFGVKYVKTPLTQQMLNSWMVAENPQQFREWMHLPPANPFLPMNTNPIQSSPAAEKDITMHLLPPNNLVRVFSLTNTQYQIPLVLSDIRIYSDIFRVAAADTAVSQMRITLWGWALGMSLRSNWSLLKQIYSETLTEVGVDEDAGCFQIYTAVLSDLLPIVLRNIAHQIMSLNELGPDDILLKLACKELEAVLSRRKQKQTFMASRYQELMFGKRGTLDQQLSALQTLKKKGLKGEPAWLLQQSAIEVLVVGNVLPKQAEQWARILAQELRLEGNADLLKQAHPMSTSQLPPGTTSWRMLGPPKWSLNDITMYVQFQKFGDDALDDEVEAALKLFLYITIKNDSILEPLKALGMRMRYKIRMHHMDRHSFIIMDRHYHTIIVGGSTEYELEATLRGIHNWWDKVVQWVTELGDAAFTSIRNSFLAFAQTPQNLVDRWTPIVADFISRRFTFDKMRRTQKILSDFSFLKFRAFWEQHLGTSRKLYMQCTRTDGGTDIKLEGERKKIAEPGSSSGELTFDRIWEGPEVPNDFKHVYLQRYHTDLAESVPSVISAPEFSFFIP